MKAKKEWIINPITTQKEKEKYGKYGLKGSGGIEINMGNGTMKFAYFVFRDGEFYSVHPFRRKNPKVTLTEVIEKAKKELMAEEVEK